MPPNPQDERRCPGEKYAISEAVCRGRIARHYPKCKDCKWREVTAGPDDDAAEPEVDLDTIFKAYDIRGLAEEQITRTLAWKVGYATARHLAGRLPEGAKPEEQWIVVGRDMRPTSEEYAQRVAEGVRAAGVGAMVVGEIETPAIYYAVGSRKALGGIQVTASHNPAAYNGFKITGPECVPVGMGSGLEEIRDIAAGVTATDLQPIGPLRQQDISSGYLLHVKKFAGNIKPMRIALDTSNGMASKWVPSLLREFIVDVEALNLERAGRFNHEPNPLNAAALEDLKRRVRATDAACGVCFDGDADRVGFVDEAGESIGNDLITALLVPEFLRDEPGATIVYDLRSTRALKEEIEKHGGVPHRERVGHSHMKKALRETNAPFGGELSGHSYFRDNYFCDSAVGTLLKVLTVLSKHPDETLSDLVAPLRRYATTGEVNFEVEDKEAAIQQLAQTFSDGTIDFLDGVTVEYDQWWFNCRPSNTEPLLRLTLEADDETIRDEQYEKIIGILGEPSEH